MSQRARNLAMMSGALVLLVGFWITVWHGMDRSALSRVPILDEAHYLQRADQIRQQGWLPADPFTMSPLYSYLVALTGSGRAIGPDQVREGPPLFGIRILQALLWLGCAWVLWQVARDLLGARWGWGPPLLWLGYGPAAILAGQVLMEVPLAFVTALALAVSGGWVGTAGCRGRALLAGALVGAAMLLRGTAVVLVVPVLWAMVTSPACRRDMARRSWLAATLPAGLALMLVVVPFVVFNSLRAGQPAPPAMNGGVNLYIGNGPGADGFYRAFPGFDVEQDPSGAVYLSRRTGRAIADAWTADRVWAVEARQAIRSNPRGTLKLWGRKVWLHLVGMEIPQVSAFSAWRRQVPLLRALPVPWALLAIGGLAGGVLAWRQVPRLRPWLLAVVLLIAVQSLFFVVTRYRLILVPTLALATSVLARELWTRRGRPLGIALAAVVLASVVVWPWGLARQRARLQAGGLDNEAVRWEHLAAAAGGAEADPAVAQEYLTEAETLYRRSRAVVGDQADSWRGLARILWTRGERDRAITLLSEGLARVTDTRAMRRDLIGMLMRQRRPAEAADQLSVALQAEPADMDLLENMVIAQAQSGRLAAATATAREMVSLHPGDPRGYLTLGKVLGQAGDLPAAAEAFNEGLRRLPRNVELKRNRDHVLDLMAAEQK